MDIWVQVAFDIQHRLHCCASVRRFHNSQCTRQSSLSSTSIPFTPHNNKENTHTHYMTAGPGYDNQNLYDLSTGLGFQLACPVHRYRSTPQERIRMIDFYESALGQVAYSKRGTSIE